MRAEAKFDDKGEVHFGRVNVMYEMNYQRRLIESFEVVGGRLLRLRRWWVVEMYFLFFTCTPRIRRSLW